MGVTPRVLLVEDSETDAELILLELRRGGFEPDHRRVESAPEMRAAMAEQTWDVIICDFNLPRFGTLAALDIVAESGLDLPFIVVSGMIQMEDAVSLMKAGAHDFVRKDDLARLAPAIERELREAELREERRAAEIALHETEKRATEAHNRLIQSIEAMSEAFILWDADDRLALFNQRHRAFFPDLAGLMVPGIPFEVMVRAAIERGIVPAAVGREEEWLRQRLENHRNPKGPSLLLTADGRWLRHNEYRTPDGGSVSMCTDETEQVRRDEELRNSEERYRSVTQSAGAAIIVADGHGQVISWNQGARRVFGFSEAEMIGKSLVELIPERCREAHEAGFARLRDQGGAHMVGNTVDLHGLRKNGEEFPLELSLGTWTAGGDVFVSAIIRDISERRQAEGALRESEQRLRAIMDNSPTSIHLKDVEGRYLLVNRKHEEWHRASLEDIRGKTAHEVLPKEIADAYCALDQLVMETGETHERELEAVYPDGVRRATVGIRFPIFSPDNAIVGVGGMGVDITERKKGEEEFRKAKEEAEIANRAKNDFLAATSFELRTPLNDIIGFSDLIKAEMFGPLNPPRYRGYVEDINASAKQLLEIINDMMDLSRLETALKKDEKSYRSLVYLAPDCICILRDGEITLINPAGQQMFETPHADGIVGRKLADLAHPDDRDLLGDDLESLAKESTRVAVRFRRFDGGVIDTEVSALALDQDEGGEAVMVVIRDVTERKRADEALKESEARFRHVVEQAADGILMHDVDGKIIDVNHRLCGILGYSRDHLLNLSVSDISRELPPEGFHAIRQEILDGGPITRQDVHRRKDGSTVAMEVRISVFDWRGRQLLLVLARDISERKRMEQQLLQAQKMEAVGQLTGGMAHDFNNLLTVILGNLEWLGERLDGDEDLRFIVDSAADSARRGAELTQRLLAFSRKQPLQPKTIDLHDTLREMHPLIARTLGEGISFEIKVAAGLLRTKADPSQLENAVLNLAINARISEEDAAGRPGLVPGVYVVLAVSDTGTGMPAEVVARAFEPFFTTKETGRGSGLGLSMIYGFVKQSGGYVEIDSTMGKGTTVSLFLPAVGGAESHTEAEDGVDVLADLPSGSETILIVEDDAMVRDFIVRTLSRLGYRTFEASTGPAALSVLGRTPGIDMLFTDIVMPGGINGFELAASVAERHPHIRVLLMSGYSFDQTARDGMLEQGFDLIGKPFTRHDLARKIRAVLEA